jgi:integrase
MAPLGLWCDEVSVDPMRAGLHHADGYSRWLIEIATTLAGRRPAPSSVNRRMSALASFDAQLGDRTTGPIFTTRIGQRMTRVSAYRLLQRLARTAEIPAAADISPNSARHAFATLALDAGVPLGDVQDAMGHADPRTTGRYDRSRHSLDRHATYAVAAYVATHDAASTR